jgi:hypothetical protein
MALELFKHRHYFTFICYPERYNVVKGVVRSVNEIKASGIFEGKAPESCSFVNVDSSVTGLKYLVHRLRKFEVV